MRKTAWRMEKCLEKLRPDHGNKTNKERAPSLVHRQPQTAKTARVSLHNTFLQKITPGSSYTKMS